ncbi:MAG: hypothetical protein Aureis2KO_08640 [Aureisphaera sp.]
MKLIATFLFFVLSVTTHAQYFSGEIEYETSIILKDTSLSLDSIWSLKNGSTSKYLISPNLYKSTYLDNGNVTYVYTYDDVSKRMYDEVPDSPYITYRDSRKSNYEYYGSKINRDSIVEVLGRECFAVHYDSEYGKSTTFYSDEIKVDYESFKGHKVGNWYEKLKEVNGCITMKAITEFEDYIEIREAVKITSLELTRDDFEVPSDKIIVASYSALDKPAQIVEPTQKQIECYQQKIREGQQKKPDAEKITCYLSFVLTKNGEIKYVEPVDMEHPELNTIALDILNSCSMQFTPGEINGRPVSSLTYLPVEF